MTKLYLALALGFVCAHSGCTTPIPVDQSQGSGDPQSPAQLTSEADVTLITQPQSLFSQLAQDPATLDQWEKSDGWVMFYQGKLQEAIDAFSEGTPRDALGLARAHLELAESYQSFATATLKVTREWLQLERQSPHAALYKRWIDWTELTLYALLSELSSERATALSASLKSTPEMTPWAEVAAVFDPELTPPKASTAYRLWLGFAQQVSLSFE